MRFILTITLSSIAWALISCNNATDNKSRYKEPEWVEIDWSKVVPMRNHPKVAPTVKPNNFSSSVLPSKKRITRMIKGIPADPFSRPFQVALIVDGTYLAGGSIITAGHVLTAAHNLHGMGSVQIIAGTINIRVPDLLGCQRKTVLRNNFEIHADYNPDNAPNDIAIINLPLPFALTNAVSVIRLYSGDEDFVFSVVRASGWGNTSQGTISAVLRYIDYPVLEQHRCVVDNELIIASQFCTKSTNAGTTCYGDSGGAVQDNQSERQIGIISYGSNICDPAIPSVHTRISSFAPWIRERAGLNF